MTKVSFSFSIKSSLFAINAASAEIFSNFGAYKRTLGYMDGSGNPSFTGSAPINQTFYDFQGWDLSGAPAEPAYFPETLSGFQGSTTSTGLDATSGILGLKGSDFVSQNYLVLVAHIIPVEPDGTRVIDNSVTLSDLLGSSLSYTPKSGGTTAATLTATSSSTTDLQTAYAISILSGGGEIVIGTTISNSHNSAFVGFAIPLNSAFDSADIGIVITGTGI